MRTGEAKYLRADPDRHLAGPTGAAVWLAPVSDGRERDDDPWRGTADLALDDKGVCVVELWDETRQAPEQMLAIARSATIGYAAFYAAARDHADRYITLRCGGHVMARWNGPQS